MIESETRIIDTIDINTPLKLSTRTVLYLMCEAFKEFQLLKKREDYHTLAMDTSTITHYLLYKSFDMFMKSKKHVSYQSIYNRVNYYLNKVEAEQNPGTKDWLISPEVKRGIKLIYEGTNGKSFDEEEAEEEVQEEIKQISNNSTASLNLDLSQFIREQKAYACAICGEVFPSEILAIEHLPTHKLSDFLQEDVESK